MKFTQLIIGLAVIGSILFASMFVLQGILLFEQSSTLAKESATAAAALDMKIVALGKMLTGIFTLLLGIFAALVQMSFRVDRREIRKHIRPRV